MKNPISAAAGIITAKPVYSPIRTQAVARRSTMAFATHQDSKRRGGRDPRGTGDGRAAALDAVLFGVVAEGAIRHAQQVGGFGAHAAGLLQGGGEIMPFDALDETLQAVGRERRQRVAGGWGAVAVGFAQRSDADDFAL